MAPDDRVITAGWLWRAGRKAIEGRKTGAIVDDKPVMVWLPTARFHDLRHTYASIRASQGAVVAGDPCLARTYWATDDSTVCASIRSAAPHRRRRR